MLFVVLDDGSAQVEVSVYAEMMEQHRNRLREDQLLIVQAKVTNDEYSGGMRVVAEQIYDLQLAREARAKALRIRLNGNADAVMLKRVLNPFRAAPENGLPGTPVEWEEINAGLGQVNLLLCCLARKVKLEFKRYRLVPYGSFSYIQVIENTGNYKAGDQLNMYRLKGYKYYFDWDSKFDQSMIAFLDCLNQFEEKIKSIDPQFSMPYKINGYKLEDKNGSSYSIRCQFNSHEEWTKALKYMLTNLKWSLAWVTSQSDNTST
jgi:hypothetical protein